MLQCHAFQKFHDNECQPVVLVNLMDGANIRVVESRRRLRLALKAAKGLRITGHSVRKKLQRHKSAELDVFGFINDSHASATELLGNAVVRDCLSNHES